MSFYSTIKFIANHPLNKENKIKAIGRFMRWQINSRLNPYPIIYNFTSKSKLIIQRGMTGATGNLYCGLHEYEDMSFVLDFLRPEDTFFDVGANIGSYTVLASAHVGAKAVAFEPVPETFQYLCNNVAINHVFENTVLINSAVGATEGILHFTKNEDTTNHVVDQKSENSVEVKVETLDSMTLKYGVPQLIKIDVEGFETEVLKGAKNLLENKDLKAIIIELNGSGERYGYNENLIHDLFRSLGYEPFTYSPEAKKMCKLSNYGSENTIYVRDLEFVNKRINAR